MLSDFNLFVIMVVAILFMAIAIALMMYGFSFVSVMELWDYESWTESFGYALLITFILVTLSFFEIVLFLTSDFKASINLTGVVVPLAASIYLLIRKKVTLRHAAIAIGLVALVAMPLVVFRDGQIAIDFPLWLLPAGLAAALAWLLVNGQLEKALPLAYIAGSVGMLLGGDILRLLVEPRDLTEVYLGANGLLDFVFLGGVIACGILVAGYAAVPLARKLAARFPGIKEQF
jgi:hypothetical protein